MLLIEFLKLLKINAKITAYESNFLMQYIILINRIIIEREINFFNKLSENEKKIINDTVTKQTCFLSDDEVLKYIKSKSYSFGESVECIFNKFIENQILLLPENKEFVNFFFTNSSNLLIFIPANPSFDDVKSFLLKFYLKYNDLNRESKKQLYLLYPNIDELMNNRKFNNLIIKFIQLSD